MIDPRNAWQSQPAEPFRLTPELLRYKARDRQQKARNEMMRSIVLGAVLFALFGWSCWRAPNLSARLGYGVVAAWCLYFAGQSYRRLRPADLPPDAEFGSCLAFYRAELEKRRDWSTHIWRRSGIPFCFLGVALLIGPAIWRMPRQIVNAMPFLILLIVGFFAFFRLKNRRRKELDQEIEQLRAFERQ